MPENPTDERPLKAYYIDKPQRTITTFRVFAGSASEALELDDEWEQIDSITVGSARPKARRAPQEDDDV